MIEIEGFRKEFKGFVAVEDLTMEIEEGAIYGFVGPNGAGKTTTIRFLATLLAPTRGTARVNGFDVVKQPREVRRCIGYMPDAFGVYEGMKVWQYLDFFGACYELSREKRRRIVGDVLELVDLLHKRDTNVEALSRGMRQRLCLAKTLIHDPPVLILDEPASGLDPRARVEIKELLKELCRMGKTIFISSHILSELADLCSHLGVIERGKLLVSEAVDEIYRRIRDRRLVRMEVVGQPGKAEWLLKREDLVSNLLTEDHYLQFEFSGTAEEKAALLHRLMDGGVQVASFSEMLPNLEEAFMALTKGEIG
jgi:ABC-2 type transport system ATP-binding protein